MPALNDALGATIRTFRQNKGLSQEELAARAGVHRTYISQLERGIKSPTLLVLVEISRALDIRSSYLLSIVENLLD